MILLAERLTKRYSRGGMTFAAVDEADFSIEAGSFTVLMGESGCGKSTLFHLLTGMCRPNSGRVLFQGRELTAMSSRELAQLRRTDIGYILQGHNLLNNFTVGENVCMPCFLGKRGPGIFDRAKKLLSDFGLGGMEDEMPSSLSGGEQRRVAIARAFVHHPQLVIADEPTSNLDDKNSEIILNYLKAAAKEGAAVIMSTHAKDAASYGESLWRMAHGRLTF